MCSIRVMRSMCTCHRDGLDLSVHRGRRTGRCRRRRFCWTYRRRSTAAIRCCAGILWSWRGSHTPTSKLSSLRRHAVQPSCALSSGSTSAQPPRHRLLMCSSRRRPGSAGCCVQCAYSRRHCTTCGLYPDCERARGSVVPAASEILFKLRRDAVAGVFLDHLLVPGLLELLDVCLDVRVLACERINGLEPLH